MRQEQIKNWRLERRIRRVRKKVVGTPTRPRLCVTRSNRNIGAQIIDDTTGRTLCAVHSLQKELRQQLTYGGNCKAAAAVGRVLGEKARALGIAEVCFDRRGRRYHGRIKALADAAREAGLKF
jgi:large subunit ribosomal protein L18